MSRSRVLMTSDVVGGVWDFCLTLAEASSADVTLLALGSPSAAQQRAAAGAGVELLCAPLRLEWMQRSAADVIATQRLVERLVVERRPDVVHANQFAAACIEADVPVVLTMHSDVLSWRKWTLGDKTLPPAWQPYAQLVQSALQRADRVVAVSAFLAREVRALYGTDRDIEVIHNGWPLPTVALAKPPGQKARPRTLMAGRVWDSAKNIVLAAEAARDWDVGDLVLVGDTIHPDGGGTASVPPPLRPLGVLSRQQLDAELRRADTYLSPARYDPFGLLPLQAALSGCALLLSDIPSYRELWVDAAVFFGLDEPEDLRQQWRRLVSDDDLRLSLQHAALACAQKYSAERMATEYAVQYRAARQQVAA